MALLCVIAFMHAYRICVFIQGTVLRTLGTVIAQQNSEGFEHMLAK